MTLKEFFATLKLDVDKAGFSLAQGLLEGVKGALIGIAGMAVGAATGLGHLVKETSETADAIDEASQIAGVGAKTLQELTYAAGFSGMGLGEMRQTFVFLNRNMAAAAKGGGEAADAFKKLKVPVKGANGDLRASDEVLMDVADKLSAMPDGAEKTAIAMQVFGRSGMSMIPFLNAGRDGIAKLREEAEDLGVVLDDETIKQGAEFDDSMTRLHASLTGLRNIVAGPLLKGFNEILKGFLAWIKANRQLVKQRVDKIVKLLLEGFKLLAIALKGVWFVLGKVIDNIEIFAALLGGVALAAIYANISALAAAAGGYLAAGAAGLAAGLRAAFAWTAAALPVIVLAALLALVILIIQDLYVALHGGNSLVEKLWYRWSDFIDSWLADTDSDPWWLLAIKGLLYFILHLGEAWDDGIAYWKQAFTDFWQWLVDQANQMAADVGGALQDALSFLPGVDGSVNLGSVINKANGPVERAQAYANAHGPERPISPTLQRIKDSGKMQGPQQVNTKAEIHIYQQPGENASDVADKVATRMQEFHETKVREAMEGSH